MCWADIRWDLQPSEIAEEFDRNLELWARGIPYKASEAKGDKSGEGWSI